MGTIRFTTDPGGNEIGLYCHEGSVGRNFDDRNVQAALHWSVRAPATPHVVRHTAGTAVERVAGKAVTEAFLGHSPGTRTDIYTQAALAEVAAVVAYLTGEPHLLADPRWRPRHAA